MREWVSGSVVGEGFPPWGSEFSHFIMRSGPSYLQNLPDYRPLSLFSFFIIPVFHIPILCCPISLCAFPFAFFPFPFTDCSFGFQVLFLSLCSLLLLLSLLFLFSLLYDLYSASTNSSLVYVKSFSHFFSFGFFSFISIFGWMEIYFILYLNIIFFFFFFFNSTIFILFIPLHLLFIFFNSSYSFIEGARQYLKCIILI